MEGNVRGRCQGVGKSVTPSINRSIRTSILWSVCLISVTVTMLDICTALVTCDLQRREYTQIEGIVARDKGCR